MAEAAYRAILSATASHDHPVELLLCGHHYRHSRCALDRAGAIVDIA